MARMQPARLDLVLWTALPAAAMLSITAGQALAAVAIARWWFRSRPRWPAGLAVPVAVFLAWSAAAALLGGGGTAALRDGTGKWLFILLLPAAWRHTRSGADLRWPLLGLLAAVVALLPFSIQAFLDGPGGRAGALSGGGPHLGSNLMMALVIAAAFSAAASRPLLRRASGAAAALLAGGLALTLNRAAALGSAAGLAVIFARRRPALLAVALIATAGWLAARPDAKPVLRLRAGLLYPVDDTSRERVLMWTAGLHMVRDRPWAGLGGRSHFIRTYESEYRHAEAREPKPGHVHNSWIQTAVLHGMPGLGLLLWWLAVLVRHAAAGASRHVSPSLLPAGGAILPLLVAVLVNACFDFVLADGQHALMWYALTGLLLGSARSISPRTRPVHRR